MPQPLVQAPADRLHALRALIPGLLPSDHGDLAPDNDLFCLPAFRGKLVEISATAHQGALSAAAHLLLDAQLAGENCAYITLAATFFYAPDAAALGLDLAALPVITAPDPLMAGRAASHLLRSQAFGVVVIDLTSALPRAAQLPQPLLSRLVGLAKKADSALIILTDKAQGSESLGSIVGLHLSIRRAPAPPDDSGQPRFTLTVEATKDKRRGPGWTQRLTLPAPPELE